MHIIIIKTKQIMIELSIEAKQEAQVSHLNAEFYVSWFQTALSCEKSF